MIGNDHETVRAIVLPQFSPEEPLVRLIPNSFDVRLAEPLTFYSAELDLEIKIVPPFVSDLLSVPWIARRLIPKGGPGRIPALIHDKLCDDGKLPVEKREFPNISSDMAHRLLYEGMVATGVSEWRRNAIYGAVYYFGPQWDRAAEWVDGTGGA